MRQPKTLTVAVVYDLKTDYARDGLAADELAEFDDEDTIDSIAATISELGFKPVRVGNVKHLVQRLAAGEHKDWDLVFNIAEGYWGSAREAQVPALLEAHQLPSVFSDAMALTLCHDKALTKVVLERHGIPTAPFVALPAYDAFKPRSLAEWHAAFARYPYTPFTAASPAVLVKPSAEGTSKGIYDFCRARDADQLNSAVSRLRERFPVQDLLVEAFLDGREFSVCIVGTGSDARVIGTMEHPWKRGQEDNFFTYEQKQSYAGAHAGEEDNHVTNPANATDTEIIKAGEVALSAWRALGCRDGGRVDIRSQGWGADAQPLVIEVNALVALRPDYSCMTVTAKEVGINYTALLGMIFQSALQRVKTE